MDLYLPTLSCSKCDERLSSKREALILEINDSNHYEATCPNGHKSTIALQSNKFEILFEMGAVALLEGYYREAVANLTGALERFLEFYVEVKMLKAGVDVADYASAWKLVANQSERQLGGFIFVFLQEHKRTPKYLDSNTVSFRNNVIHKGYIPTYDEVCKFGQAVLSFMDPIFEDIKNNETDSRCAREVFWRNMRRYPDLTNTVALPTIVTNSRIKYFTGERDFKTEVEKLSHAITTGIGGGEIYGVRGRRPKSTS